MHCRFNFSLPSAGSVSLIITLTNFAVPHMPDEFTFFPPLSASLSRFTGSIGSALKVVLLSFTISSWPLSSLPFHPTHVYYMNVVPSPHLLLLVQDYLLTFQLCSQGTAGTKSDSTQQTYLLTAVSGQTQDICLAARPLVKM